MNQHEATIIKNFYVHIQLNFLIFSRHYDQVFREFDRRIACNFNAKQMRRDYSWRLPSTTLRHDLAGSRKTAGGWKMWLSKCHFWRMITRSRKCLLSRKVDISTQYTFLFPMIWVLLHFIILLTLRVATLKALHFWFLQCHWKNTATGPIKFCKRYISIYSCR